MLFFNCRKAKTMKKLLIHKTRQLKKENKVIYYQASKYRHLIIFNPAIEHYKVIKKLQRHFLIRDNNCKAGVLIEDKKIIFYHNIDKMYNLNQR